MDPSWVAWYDKTYAFKNYAAEVDSLLAVIAKYKGKKGGSLLDVACGTGKHLEYLRNHFDCQGLDLQAGLLAFARQRNPDMVFHQGDMRSFNVGQQFDVITCLFSAIGYLPTLEDLDAAIACMARHLSPGGLLLVEPWFTPDAWHAGNVHSLVIDEPDLKLVRMNTSLPAEGRLSLLDFHYLIGTPEKTEYVHETIELYLLEQDEMRRAFEKAGLVTHYDPQGITGRGLWVGMKQPPG